MSLAFRIPLIIGTVLIWTSCSTDRRSADTFSSPKTLFIGYISGYTTGQVSRTLPIKVRFAKNVEKASPGEEAREAYFSFSPPIAGRTFWEDRRTLVFQPEEPLQSAVQYHSTLQLHTLFDTPADRNTFRFIFETLAQDYEVKFGGPELYDAEDLTKVKFGGTVYTADFAEYDAVERMVHAVQSGEPRTITWRHNPAGTEHSFTIEHIARTEVEEELEVRWNGASIGVKEEDSKTLHIPALGNFTVVGVGLVRGVESYVRISFSDPLQSGQDMRGLIRFGNMEAPPVIVAELNEMRIYPTRDLDGKIDITVFKEIRNRAGYQLGADYRTSLEFSQAKPAVRLTKDSRGVIMPASGSLILPFEAISLKSVRVTAIRIFDDNVLQYLQVNDLGGTYQLRRVGRPVLSKTMPLLGGGTMGRDWTRYTLDLSELLTVEPGAVYQIKIGFRKDDINYFCGNGGEDSALQEIIEEEAPVETLYWDEYDSYYYYDDYDWSQRDNPCDPSYYGDRRGVHKILFASDLGIIAKGNDQGDFSVFVTNLLTTQPIGGVDVEVFDYQRQKMGSAVTDSDGRAEFTLQGSRYFLVASHAGQFGYLKLNDGSALSMSNFNVTGEKVEKGLKGFLYGERGVWRPGDTLHLTFIVQDTKNMLADGQPVVLELYNPLGQLYSRTLSSEPVGDMFTFNPHTVREAPTGNWLAKVKVGGTVFNKQIKIETIKPNRLKINLDFGTKQIAAGDRKISGDLAVRWLHGAKAGNLKAEFEMQLFASKTAFKQYPNFLFDDPSRAFVAESALIYQGRLDEEGHAEVTVDLNTEEEAPGALKAVFKGKVFEEGGDFSVDQFSIPYYPYQFFVGVKAPPGDRRGMLQTDKDHVVRIATVDAEGNPVSRDNIRVELYELHWRWWWDNRWEDLSNYVGSSYKEPVLRDHIRTRNGEGTWKFRIDRPAWGRYYVRAYDVRSGHAAGQIIYIDWPGWAGKGKRGELGGAAMLDISVEKEQYIVGEKVLINIPSGVGGRALVSLENGSRILQSRWMDTAEGKTAIEFETTKDMAPNVYIHIGLVQPHAQTSNDLPIRLYGVQNIEVTDPDTRLNPKIEMPKALSPEQQFEISVSEQQGRSMAYTVAVVDEGLLDITRFSTPKPWSEFYRREALGIKTWDMYDDVLGAYGGRIQRLLAVGGDDEIKMPDEEKAQRFKPVVLFEGPFELKAGEKAIHRFRMPQYVGSVRAMVVAAHGSAYGASDHTVPVKQALMALATLPRVAGPGESVLMPVNLFNTDNKDMEVEVTVHATGRLAVEGPAVVQVRVDASDEKLVFFRLNASDIPGFAKVQVKAVSGSVVANYDVELDVRPSNPETADVQQKLLTVSENWDIQYTPLGISTTNAGILELSVLPPLNLEQRLRYLIRYPHGCIEQVTSAVFAQLYLDQLTALDTKQQSDIERNVKSAIERLRSFQVSAGGFSYWPGRPTIDEWGTNYAGHFLVEARKKGYYVPAGMMASWIAWQVQQANNWAPESTTKALTQAYRLYTLALAEDPALGAMNRMKEMQNIGRTARWRLALAYATLGHSLDAQQIIDGLGTEVEPYRELSGTYGSATRDRAMILETLTRMGRTEEAFDQVQLISDKMGNGSHWMSTQTTAYCLIAIAQYVDGYPPDTKMDATVTVEENRVVADPKKFIAQFYLDKPDETAQVRVTNNGSGPLFARLVRLGIPVEGEEAPRSDNIDLQVRYADMQGNPISTDVIVQGTSFKAEVSVFNRGVRGDYSELALTQIFPSGWEIINTRLHDEGGATEGAAAKYMDIRDDRVMHYFDLKANQRKTFTVLLNASYRGRYYAPAVAVQAMYDNRIQANNAGKWVEVVHSD